MIYLDNSATSYPKPQSVINSFNNSLINFGGNSGRSAYEMAVKTSEQIYYTREKIANFFMLKNPENVVFTLNCTTALNMAIKGLAGKGSHFIISDLEHNAVLRPLEKLKEKGICTYSIARVEIDDKVTVKNFENKIQRNTVAIISTGASNVFGIKSPIRELGELAHKNKLLFVLDGAQTAGIIPINIEEDNVDILCCAGHKGLLGPTGTGLLLKNCDKELDTIIEGGTGSNSLNFTQPNDLPDRFESGTPNIPGIIALGCAIDFINSKGISNIYKHEKELIDLLCCKLKQIKNIQLYFDRNDFDTVPILSFNVKDWHSEKTAEYLSKCGVCVRAGLHCAPLAHKKLGTVDTGTVRISPSIFTEKRNMNFLINCVRKIAK